MITHISCLLEYYLNIAMVKLIKHSEGNIYVITCVPKSSHHRAPHSCIIKWRGVSSSLPQILHYGFGSSYLMQGFLELMVSCD